jgi:hypothetical protein
MLVVKIVARDIPNLCFSQVTLSVLFTHLEIKQGIHVLEDWMTVVEAPAKKNLLLGLDFENDHSDRNE